MNLADLPGSLVLTGAQRRAAALPLGGLGTGHLCLGADGSLRQWQIQNRINHLAALPGTGFGLFTQEHQDRWGYWLVDPSAWENNAILPVTTSDHLIPEAVRSTAQRRPTVKIERMIGAYPAAELHYDLGSAPIELRLCAWSPFVPLDELRSGRPVVHFEFTARNRRPHRVHCALVFAMLNPLGWDGRGLIRDHREIAFGGNLNRFHSDALTLTSGLPDDHPDRGEIRIGGDGGKISADAQFQNWDQFWARFHDQGEMMPSESNQSSPPHSTWYGALQIRRELEPEETATYRFTLGWHYPNRYVDWEQWTSLIPNDKSRFYLGNHYSENHSLEEIFDEAQAQIDADREATERYLHTVYGATAPVSLIQAAAANLANLRTNICFRTPDGTFHGFEGGLGASTWTGVSGTGGCCPMNCTHVWNYEQALANFFPVLFDSMRETDWRHNQHATGYLPHRTPLPLYLPRLWEVPIDGPTRPAIDGLFAGVLKSYQSWDAGREVRYDSIRRAMNWVFDRMDPDRGGILRGEQPVTHDIHLYGVNTFVGTQYLAALFAMAQLAEDHDDLDLARQCRETAERGAIQLDELCWNGEHFIQIVEPGTNHPHQFGEGCLTDQLLGEWWSSLLGLPTTLNEDRLRTAIRTIFERNFVRDFEGVFQSPRRFCEAGDAGLLVCTYPSGKRPDVPLLYSDEAWPGSEYAFAALAWMLGEDAIAETVTEAVRARYDGSRRNPWNEVECGDHYIRSLAAASLWAARSGARYSARRRTLTLRKPLGAERHYLPHAQAHFTISESGVEVSFGRLEVDHLITTDGQYAVSIDLGPGQRATF